MNERKIAFIICVNNDMEFDECKCYLERLEIPKEYEIEVISVVQARSMAAGYNEAMESTDAKYKIYMHQDTFIKNKYFVKDILSIFQNDDQIGLLGVIGRKHLEEKMWIAADWDTGMVLHNSRNGILNFPMDLGVEEVDAVDGLLIATQYDIKWREDIFDGWDFYDISQCMEFKRHGYKVVVPKQEEAWCYHDNTYSKLKKYFVYQARFCEEYRDFIKIDMQSREDSDIEMEELLENLKKNMEILVTEGNQEEMITIFKTIGNRNYFALREYSAIAQIAQLEKSNGIEKTFWTCKISVEDLMKKLHILRYKLKRLEYGIEDALSLMEQIHAEYSVFAVAVVVNFYVGYKKVVVPKIQECYWQMGLQEESHIWSMIAEEFVEGI